MHLKGVQIEGSTRRCFRDWFHSLALLVAWGFVGVGASLHLLQCFAGDAQEAALGLSPGATTQDGRIWGTVVRDGKPVARAEVGYMDWISERARLMGGIGHTDEQGRIFVYRIPQAEKLVVRLGEAGGEVDARTLTNGFQVVLGAHGRVEGTLYLAGKPWANQRIGFSPRWAWPLSITSPQKGQSVSQIRGVMTDSEGRFAISDLPGGTWDPLLLTPSPPHRGVRVKGLSVSTNDLFLTASPFSSVQVMDGPALHLELHPQGRTLVGQLAPPNSDTSMDRLWFMTIATSHLSRGPRNIPAVFQPDGKFYAFCDEPAGEHRFYIEDSDESLETGLLRVKFPEATGAESEVIDLGQVRVRKAR